jgi:hypothetical protein
MSHSREQDLSASDENVQYVLDIASHVGAWIAAIIVSWLVEDIGRPCRCPMWHDKTVHVCDVKDWHDKLY